MPKNTGLSQMYYFPKVFPSINNPKTGYFIVTLLRADGYERVFACESEALDHTNSLQTHFPAHN